MRFQHVRAMQAKNQKPAVQQPRGPMWVTCHPAQPALVPTQASCQPMLLRDACMRMLCAAGLGRNKARCCHLESLHMEEL